MIRVTSTLRLKAFSHSINAIFRSKEFPPRLADYKAPAFIHTPKTSLLPFSLGVHKALKELHAYEIVCTKYEHYVKVLTPKALCHTYPSWLPNSRWDLPLKRTFLLCSFLKFPQVRKAYSQKEQMKPIGEAPHLLSHGLGAFAQLSTLTHFQLACLSKKNAICIMDNSLEFNYSISLSP